MALKMDLSSRIEITEMELDDLDEVMSIERKCFPTPWPRGVFEMEVRSVRSHNFVAKIDGVLCGYIVTWRIYDEVHILNVAVHPKFRRLGLGRALVEHCFAYHVERGARHALLEVRESNEAAQGLYEKLGFTRVGVRHNYYTDNGEDAIVMIKVFD